MGPGRAAGRGDLLHAQRLSDHRHAARSDRSRGRAARRLLARARATPAAGAVPDAGGGRHVGHRRRAGAATAVQGSRRRRRPVRQQLAADPPARLLLRALRPCLAAEPPVVARRRGAVLHRLAAAAAARRAPDPRAAHRRRPAPAPGRGHADPRGRLGRRDGAALPAQLRSLADLLRHRHARLRDPRRRGARDGLAERPPAQRHQPGRAAHARLPGRDRPARDLRADRADQSVLGLPLPRRLRAAGARHGPAARRARASRGPPWRRARLRAAALDRRALLRHLPVERADHRAHHAGLAATASTCCATPCR